MNSSSSIDHRPAKSHWEFDAQVSSCFPDMARRSIPLYDQTVSELVRFVGRVMARTPKQWIDLGSARGRVIEEAIAVYGRAPAFCMVEPSQPMFDLLNNTALFDGIDKRCQDALSVLTSYADESVDVVSCMWTMQFVPIDQRQTIFKEIRRVLRSDGVMLYAEKLEGQTPRFADLLRERYEDFKVSNGYSRESIALKRDALKGVMTPISAPANKALANNAGFDMEEVLRFFNFAAWICLPR